MPKIMVMRKGLFTEVKTNLTEALKVMDQGHDLRDNGEYADLLFDVRHWLDKTVKAIDHLYGNPGLYGLNGDDTGPAFDDDDMNGAI